MSTSVMFSIRMPEEFDLQTVEPNFKKEFKRLGVNIDYFEKLKTSSVELPGDDIYFKFKTDSELCNPNLYERVRQEAKYDRLEYFKEEYNKRNKIKIETINLCND